MDAGFLTLDDIRHRATRIFVVVCWLHAPAAAAVGLIARNPIFAPMAVAVATGRLLPCDADAETVTHEVFFRLLSDPACRASFKGGNFAAWITRVASNAAIDHLRRNRRERGEPGPDLEQHGDAHAAAARIDEQLEAKRLVERFRRECLPPAWAGVFEARFVRRLAQREAARELRMHRTTLVYQEHRIRRLLADFLARVQLP